MFYTLPEAEVPIHPAFAHNGERAWRSVEFSLQIPYFLAALHFRIEGGPFTRHLLTGNLHQVVALAKLQDGHVQLKRVSLLSPGHMNGTASFELGPIVEAWIGKTYPDEQLFVLTDGRELRFPEDAADTSRGDMELILSLPTFRVQS